MTLINSDSSPSDRHREQNQPNIAQLITKIEDYLLPNLDLISLDPNHPVIVNTVPCPWKILGTGNYAAVFYHPDYPDLAIKIYAPGRAGWAEEVEVYRRLGKHSAFSQCFYAQNNYLILQRLHGITLYDSLHRGLKIPPQVIQDIDLALEYACSRGLFPHDIHGRNVMMSQGRGLVVDISDFLKTEPCLAWSDLKIAYQWIYLPFFSWHRLPVPYFILDIVRFIYRLWRQGKKSIQKFI